jgi:hypothetical protein
MTIEEIRSGFLNFYEKRLRLQLLNAELMALGDSVRSAFILPYDAETKYSLITFEMQTIESIVADTYPLTAEQPQLLATLHKLRQQVIVANNKARVFFSSANLPLTNQSQMIKQHNEFMAHANAQIAELAKQAQSLLAPLLIQ